MSSMDGLKVRPVFYVEWRRRIVKSAWKYVMDVMEEERKILMNCMSNSK